MPKKDTKKKTTKQKVLKQKQKQKQSQNVIVNINTKAPRKSAPKTSQPQPQPQSQPSYPVFFQMESLPSVVYKPEPVKVSSFTNTEPLPVRNSISTNTENEPVRISTSTNTEPRKKKLVVSTGTDAIDIPVPVKPKRKYTRRNPIILLPLSVETTTPETSPVKMKALPKVFTPIEPTYNATYSDGTTVTSMENPMLKKYKMVRK